jgi:hypothetical protein
VKKFMCKTRIKASNTASETELETLPAIGTALAIKTIGGRLYRNVDDVLTIKGISEVRWQRSVGRYAHCRCHLDWRNRNAAC